ncbi:MAG: putative ABC transporter permease [Clostridia bacterium]|nr:putative ABC transporter permease [Clostridia bacterium]
MEWKVVFLYFILYSIVGWCIEMIYCRICQHKWVDRGFLYGPYCPIYGFGAIILLLILQPFSANPFILFLLALVVTTILEYVTSYVMEQIFNTKWWDYSHLPLNINGRVCLLNSFEFAILTLFVIYLVHPKVVEVIGMLPLQYIPMIVTSFVMVLSVDTTATVLGLINLKDKLSYLQTLGEQIKEKTNNKMQNSAIIKQLEEIKLEIINKKDLLQNRLIKAFPNIEMPKFGTTFDEIKAAVHKYQNRKSAKKKHDSKEDIPNKDEINCKIEENIEEKSH